MVKTVRGGGSITPEAKIELEKYLASGRVILREEFLWKMLFFKKKNTFGKLNWIKIQIG
jgi:hypothetical protein